MVFKDGYERYILKIIMVGESDIQIGLLFTVKGFHNSSLSTMVLHMVYIPNDIPNLGYFTILVLCYNQWEFQDPKMEVLYNIRQYFVGIFPYVGLM
jgi:hypothetical protein